MASRGAAAMAGEVKRIPRLVRVVCDPNDCLWYPEVSKDGGKTFYRPILGHRYKQDYAGYATERGARSFAAYDIRDGAKWADAYEMRSGGDGKH